MITYTYKTLKIYSIICDVQLQKLPLVWSYPFEMKFYMRSKHSEIWLNVSVELSKTYCTLFPFFYVEIFHCIFLSFLLSSRLSSLLIYNILTVSTRYFMQWFHLQFISRKIIHNLPFIDYFFNIRNFAEITDGDNYNSRFFHHHQCVQQI